MANALEDRKLDAMSDKDDIAHIEKASASPLATGDVVVENAALERALNRKFDVHILPWLFGIW